MKKRSKNLRSAIHQHLHYYQAWLVVCCPPLIYHVQRYLATGLTSQGVHYVKDERPLLNWCVNVAEEITRILELLPTSNSLIYRSYTNVQGCVAAATMILLCGIIDRKLSYETIADFAMSSLSCIITNTNSFQSALDFICSFQGITNAAHERCRTGASGHSGSYAKDTISASYGSWLSNFENGEQYVPPSAQAIEDPLDIVN
jgi:hypothetical protein